MIFTAQQMLLRW